MKGDESNAVEDFVESVTGKGTAAADSPESIMPLDYESENLTLVLGNNTLNVTDTLEEQFDFSNDAAWILTATFIIFTMQSGFGLLESGAVSMKNETNIMVKNVVDVVLGGLTYWLFGYALSFGESEWANPFCGWGDFALNPGEETMGPLYTKFFFQLSFATTATTIVSGAIAERWELTRKTSV
ncbi:Ammonium Transporter Family [Halocaridina rubra]|uniref:Ammonium Transporter Family n=1 Tax=Halocaridina rubra TaxID=373956 RepID=A0AAN9A5G1_HALRR